MYVVLLYIYVFEQLFTHGTTAAVILFGVYGVKFVETEDNHVFETQRLLAVHAYQLAVYAHGRFTGREAQHELFALERLRLYGFGNLTRYIVSAVFGRGAHQRGDLFITGYYVQRLNSLFEAASRH